MANGLESIGGALSSGLAISRVEFDSQFSPVITYTPGPSGEGAPSSGGLFAGLNPLRLLKPRARIYLAVGGPPIVVAPGGEPTGNFLPFLLAALSAGVAGVAWWKGKPGLAKGAGLAALGFAALGYVVNREPSPGAPVTDDSTASAGGLFNGALRAALQ